MLLPFGALFHGPDDRLVVVSQVLGIGLLAFSVGMVAAAARRLRIGALAAAIGALALAFAPWRGIASAGVEGALALACLAVLVWASAGLVLDPGNRRLAVATGLVAGVTVLARLDTVVVVAALLLTIVWAARRSLDRRRLASLAGVLAALPAALVGLYLATNLVRTGEALPVTASLKSSFPTPHLRSSFVTEYAEYYLAVGIAWIGVGCARTRSQRTVLVGLAGGATLFGLYLAAFGRGVFWWHFVSVLPAGALGVAATVDAVVVATRRRDFGRYAPAVVTAAALAVLIVPLGTSLLERSPDGRYYASSGWRVEAERAGRWTSRRLPSDALLAMKDAGAFGYYTEQPVMNLDGVISDRQFNDALCAGTAVGEMDDDGVRYVAHHSVGGSYTTFELRLPCWEQGTAPSVLEFTPDDEVYRGAAYWHGGPDRHFVIWRYDRGARS